MKKIVLPKKEDFIPHLAYDAVIFGFNGTELKIVVLEYQKTNHFALPGGFIRHDQNLDEAVYQGVQNRTGIRDIKLEQCHTFGHQNRRDKKVLKDICEVHDHQINDDHWLLGRFISVCYYALINFEDVALEPDKLSDSVGWYGLDELPELMLDHKEMVSKALEVLQKNIDEKLVGMNLLPEKFTMKDLQNVYESILQKKLVRTAFQRKILAKDILVRHEKKYTGKAHKAPYLYSFKPV